MKPIITIFLLVLSTFFCASCKKDTVSIKGNWKWIYSSSGGIFGSIIKPSAGATVRLSLNTNSTYALYLNNQTDAQGAYHITSSSGISTINFDKAIGADNLVIEQEEGIFQTKDSLFLIDNNIEASPTAVFVKVK